MLGRGRPAAVKTLAFALPGSPTARESGRRPTGPPAWCWPPPVNCTQITATVEPLARASSGLTVTTIFGGVAQSRQVSALQAGADIVVACPGRLEDLMRQKLISLDAVRVTVIDEGRPHGRSRLPLPGVTRILAATRPMRSGCSPRRWTTRRQTGQAFPAQRGAALHRGQLPVAAMTHHVLPRRQRRAKRHWCTTTSPRAADGESCSCAPSITPASWPNGPGDRRGVPSVDLHGNLSQPARDRNLAAFSSGTGPGAGGHRHRRARVHVMTSNSSLRRPAGQNTGPICTVRAAPPGPAAPATSSHSCCRAAQRTQPHCCAGPASTTPNPKEVSADSAQVQALVGERAPCIRP